MQSLQSKQALLRKQVLESELDAQMFIQYLGKIKGQGSNVDLQNWSILQLQNSIADFKQEALKSKLQFMNSRISLNQTTKKSKIFENSKKEKVMYDNTNLFDFEMYDQQQCSKSQILFNFPIIDDPMVTVEKAQIKSVGGFIFGIGARNELQVTLSTNFTANRVIRKSEDVDWLKHVLSLNFPGWYIPPLEPERQLNSDDTKGINLRKQQIQRFLVKLMKYPVFQSSQLVKVFFQQYNPKKFNQFKNRQLAYSEIERGTEGVSTLTGKFTVEISDKMNKTLKASTQLINETNQLYNEFSNCFNKIVAQLTTLQRYTKNLNEITAKLSQKYGQAQKLLKINDIKLPTIFLAFNNIAANTVKNMRRHIRGLNLFNDAFIKQTSKDWIELSNHDSKMQKEFKRYLSEKENLIRKKQRYINDPTRWQLPEVELLQLKGKDLSKIPRQQKFNKMFPSDNENQNRTRIWLAFINQNHIEAFRKFLFEQQKSLLKQYLEYSSDAICLNQELIANFTEFNQLIFH